MLVDTYWVTEELDQADIPHMLIPSVSRKMNGFVKAAGAKIRYYLR